MDRRLLALGLVTLALAVSVLAACGISSADTRPAATPIPTSTLGPPTPTNVPAGWHVYSGQHFTIAVPADWGVKTYPLSVTQQGHDVTYSFSPSTTAHLGVDVMEDSGLDEATLQHDFCPNPAHEPTVALAGLPMRYSVIEGVHRSWQFITNTGTSYQLSINDGLAGKDVQAHDDAVLATFRSEDTTPGCA